MRILSFGRHNIPYKLIQAFWSWWIPALSVHRNSGFLYVQEDDDEASFLPRQRRWRFSRMLGASDALLEPRIITPLGMVSSASKQKARLLFRENKQREFENLLGQPGINNASN